ncbi:MAG TPA: LytTR family DNA-binding domain-containing protein [Symbiobacteriaceae bacterium]|jgi:DNA-binding LytR/AlgR family response regulator|nr:LytTR family DNA-binding domain-containing protein [Symbiobacteriaceae bacterium]
MLKVLIVDDEPMARRELRTQLSEFSGVQVVGEAADAAEAQQLIDAIDYDAVFLDIQMPGLSGLDLARRLQQRERRPRVIFTTAFSQYALDAFDAGAADYLLKPFDEERLGRALARLQAGAGAPPASAAAAAGAGAPAIADRIPAEKGSKTVLVPVAEVIYAYARNEEVRLKLHGEELSCRRFTLRELEARLAPHGFLRVHRRYLVNLAKVREVSALQKAGMSVVVQDQQQTEIPVSRNLMPLIKQRLGLS